MYTALFITLNIKEMKVMGIKFNSTNAFKRVFCVMLFNFHSLARKSIKNNISIGGLCCGLIYDIWVRKISRSLGIDELCNSGSKAF